MSLRALCLVLGLGLAACVTEGPGTPPLSEVDLKEAARLNAQLGIDYMRKGQLELAMEKLARAIEQDPDLAAAHAAIAVLYAQKGENALAKRHYKKALSLDGRDPAVKNNFGTFLCGQGEIEDAEDYFLEAAQDPRYNAREAAWTNAGVCVRRGGENEKAERYLREALKINPQFPDALAQMARLAFDAGDYLRARAFVQRYEAASRPTPEVLWIAAQTERQLGDIVAAVRYERRLRTEFPDSDQNEQLQKRKGAQ
ncbi:MAG: type IV pilus biogenesis/stability protein PilW [Gammaproteobacteria bacterium]|nr:type IV pilus biogenesis/stability protein PilW [Gammaproteobacteria bacterium]